MTGFWGLGLLGLTAFTEFPEALTLVRTAVVLAAFCFLPGYLIALGWAKEKRPLRLLAERPAEIIMESLVVSLLLLGFVVILLMFTIGFTAIGLAVLEIALLGVAWLFWKRSH